MCFWFLQSVLTVLFCYFRFCSTGGHRFYSAGAAVGAAGGAFQPESGFSITLGGPWARMGISKALLRKTTCSNKKEKYFET